MTLVEELRSKKSRDNRELLDRAADRIEELERELSRLTIPPCKVGDVVYQAVDRIYKSTVKAVIYDTDNFAFDERAIGESVFLSEEEAEKHCRK